jgi:2-polyprenyl-3-methyl-5-hydroxy-6-metoxy-1,4-benzoquinol methylase
MKSNLDIEIAGSLGAAPDLLPFIPELLGDLWELGGSSQTMHDLLKPLNLPPRSTRVLDLGCGKGSVIITLALKSDFEVWGVDAFEPFINEAVRRAGKLEISDQCHFRRADLKDVINEKNVFDVVIYSAVGSILGGIESTISKLRRCVRPGGYILIDDAFLAEDADTHPPGYELCKSHKETLKGLMANGDELLKEVIISPEEMKKINQKNTNLIRQRAERLALKHPEMADVFFEYVEEQKRESEIIETVMHPAVWLLQRCGS